MSGNPSTLSTGKRVVSDCHSPLRIRVALNKMPESTSCRTTCVSDTSCTSIPYALSRSALSAGLSRSITGGSWAESPDKISRHPWPS